MVAIWDATEHLYNTEYFHPVIALLARAAALRGDSDPPKFYRQVEVSSASEPPVPNPPPALRLVPKNRTPEAGD